jgi:hypothetical protein
MRTADNVAAGMDHLISRFLVTNDDMGVLPGPSSGCMTSRISGPSSRGNLVHTYSSGQTV